MTIPIILRFEKISAADLPLVGGKGANLGEMARAGLPVPPGFCVTTAAFRAFMEASGAAAATYAALSGLAPADLAGVRMAGARIRRRLLNAPIPTDVSDAVLAAFDTAGAEQAFAVRSSATAEDLPGASFAGQQDTFLNVRGADDLLDKVRACWVSLFTDRAILYRMQNGFDHGEVALSVVVQRMIAPDVSGIMFTADPVSNHRHRATIDASYGLGEALVQGIVSPDHYKVDKRTGEIAAIGVGDKLVAIRPLPHGGVAEQAVRPELQRVRSLSDEQVRALVAMGARVEAHYGTPQDIEWGLQGGELFLLQTRPITSLYPLPEPPPRDRALRAYVSLNHAQVMTDPMPPMAISIWRLLLPFGISSALGTPNPYVCGAAGRIYLDVTPMLHHPISRRVMPRMLVVADPLIANAVGALIARADFRSGAKQMRDRLTTPRLLRWFAPLILQALVRLWLIAPEGASDKLAANLDAYIDAASERIAGFPTGLQRLRAVHAWLARIFIEAALPLPPYLMAGGLALLLLKKLTHGRAAPADLDALVRGLVGNVTTDMGLAVGDLADVARRSPELADRLQNLQSPISDLTTVPGGADFLAALDRFLQRYGARGPSEIDISRKRWRADAGSLLAVIAGNLQHTEPGAHRAHHRQLLEAGQAAAERLVNVVRVGPLGALRAALVRRMVRVVRNLMAVREHPKFMLVRGMDIARQAILEAADMLAAQGRLAATDDVWFLTLPELIGLFERPGEDAREVVAARREEFARFHHLTPPRVITSDGEILTVAYTRADLPAGALPGNPVSAGVVEGAARVVLDPGAEVLHAGEILVAPFTDPGWTPLFINAAGLVMEVGGVMTHGSVIAREYGIPAVVGVLEATKRIRTGQRIRVHGDNGYVEIL
ncbi:MAG: phosphoenolpyruvate synthase [Anaerolineales bacterium]